MPQARGPASGSLGGTNTGAREGTPDRRTTQEGGKVRRASERSTVPRKRGNPPHGDPAEGRGRLVAEPLEGNMAEASNSGTVCTRQQRIAELARQAPQMGFTSLNHLLDRRWLYEAYQATRVDGAPGVDGQTCAAYSADLPGNLQALEDRAKSGTYRAPPVRRVRIPKGTGPETRPLGIPTFEDKVLQRAVVMALEPIYEQDFLDCSYGFRPGRSAHQALQALWEQLTVLGGGWVVEVDIRQFFDTLDHAHLRRLLRQRVRDGVLLRLISKWLHAGVLEDGCLTYPEAGTPQGGVISPLLANIFLHYVLDVWFTQQVQPLLKGRAFLIRYADDFVMGFACEEDARKVLEVLPKRFGKYGLTLHPDKTRLVAFGRPAAGPSQGSGAAGAPGSFDFLGFTHYWGRSRRGAWVVKRRTSRSRFRRAFTKIADWCRRHCHLPLREQQQALWQKLRGHFAYFGITGNVQALQRFRDAVVGLWRKWLGRRRRGGWLAWPDFVALLQRFPLPAARVVHSVYGGAANP
jgi:RNA-directed DNA polymerase